ncbi:hypothetical protein [Kitasatospora sp. NPDC005751]|uniref:hypothetical protein n=1 Tax=unclassified Kitasatospora TaxID=2633591 RepID=UPI0033D18838
MRWLLLYTRSRQVPGSAAAVTLVALAWWALGRGGAGQAGPATVILVLTANVVAASVGLGGQDVVLERTAAIRWLPRRVAHVLLIGASAGAALLVVGAAGGASAPAEVVVRDSVGLAGLAALGAALCGASFAWTLPAGWLAFTLLVPPAGGTAGQVLHWMAVLPGTAASTGTAWALFATGAAAYAAAGPRR